MEQRREELVVLGTGNATAIHCYNTCFAIRDGARTLLVDAGGGNGILLQLERAGIPLADIHDVFLTHRHSDHVLGAVWLIRMAAQGLDNGKYSGQLRFYGHAELMECVETLARCTLQGGQLKHIGQDILLIPVSDGEKREVAGWQMQFFDIHSTNTKQFGFSLTLHDGGKLTCLGDEPFNEANAAQVAGSQWLLSEAFCLYSQAERFRPYEKHHSTVRDACLLAERFSVSNVVLWHTEETQLSRRKALYTAEGAEVYHGALYVPEDLEVIRL